MKWIGISLLLLVCLCSAESQLTINHDDLVMLMRAFFQQLGIVKIDSLWNCIKDSLGESWVGAANETNSIDDWNDAAQILVGVAAILKPSMEGLGMAQHCSEKEIPDLLADIKRLVNDNKAFSDKVLWNVDVFTPGLQEFLEKWQKKQYQDMGLISGALMRWIFII